MTNADTDPIEEGDETVPAVESASPSDALEARLAQYELNQQLTATQLRQLTAAVGRAQSLADKLEKTGDPQVETKVRAAMAEVYDVLGAVSDSIDPAILPDSAKQRVASAREATRRAAEQADIERRVRDAVAASTPPPAQPDANAYATSIEAQVVTELTGLGLNPDDPAIDWGRAASLLHGAGGVTAMWAYIREQERTLLAEGGPRRRPSPAPKAAGTTEVASIDTLITQYSTDPTKMKPADRAEVEKYILSAGVLK